MIGQDIVAETIINSIKSNKVPNAYLFTGIRGIGKTTTARIVAKSLNCLKGIENLCTDELCENCEAISSSSHIDVLEMDAASKTGVDDVRDLIEFSRYGPTSSKFKIFIIDEVHMLSKSYTKSGAKRWKIVSALVGKMQGESYITIRYEASANCILLLAKIERGSYINLARSGGRF